MGRASRCRELIIFVNQKRRQALTMPADDNSCLLTVFRGSLPNGAYVWSPFVTKLEARLRFSHVPYGQEAGSPQSAPKRKIPYVEFTDLNGEKRSIGDSTLIIRSLVDNDALPDLNRKLPAVQRAHDLAIRALMEDKVYFYGTREKWCDNYDEMRSNVLAAIPWPLQSVVGWLAHRGILSALHGQGTGRLSDAEVRTLKEEVWHSLNALLTESVKSSLCRRGDDSHDELPFWILGGTEPTEADATVYGFIAGALICTA